MGNGAPEREGRDAEVGWEAGAGRGRAGGAVGGSAEPQTRGLLGAGRLGGSSGGRTGRGRGTAVLGSGDQEGREARARWGGRGGRETGPRRGRRAAGGKDGGRERVVWGEEEEGWGAGGGGRELR